jgi:N-acetyl sugar amidotransferase
MPATSNARPDALGATREPRKRHECTRCILRREDDPAIQFDSDGLCQHCRTYDAHKARRRDAQGALKERFGDTADRIRQDGSGREYDSILGISGGVDSSYVAYLSRQFGLRPLAVHLDNGWDSELAVKNIEGLLKGLNIELFTHVISWPEFRDLQLAYLQASVVDIEAITDHAIGACLFRAARAHRVRYILSGANVATEGFLPSSWVHAKNDLMNIRAIHRRFGKIPLRTFPTLGVLREGFYRAAFGVTFVPVLDQVPYVKEEAKSILTAELGWRDYGGKHYESVFTRFYQAYILPRKFGIDKRRSHFSTLICAGQMSREEALRLVAEDPYDPALLAQDREFVLKKLGLGEAEFARIMTLPRREHLEFASHTKLRAWLRRVLGPLAPSRRA